MFSEGIQMKKSQLNRETESVDKVSATTKNRLPRQAKTSNEVSEPSSQTLSSPQKSRLNWIIGAKKKSDFNLFSGVRKRQEPNQEVIKRSTSGSNHSERVRKNSSISPGPNEAKHYLTSRDRDSPLVAAEHHVRLSAHSEIKEKHKQQISSTRKAMFSLQGVRSKFAQKSENPYKADDLKNKVKYSASGMSDSKAGGIHEIADKLKLGRLGDQKFGHKPKKSTKLGENLSLLKNNPDKKTPVVKKKETKNEEKYNELKSKLFQLLNK